MLYGGTEADLLYGGLGQDTLFGDAGVDTLFGDAGNDLLYGGADADLLYGGADQDTLYGDGGNDTLFGEDGNDQLFGGDNADLLYGGAGLDTLFGGAGTDLLYGGADADLLYGGADQDTLFGGDGNDTLYGDAGNDSLYGEDGNDQLFGGDNADLLYGGLGADTLYGDAGSDTLYGGDGGDLAYGGADADTIYGDAGNDTLFGDGGNDVLFGGTGNDLAYGGSEADLIYGGADQDTLYGDGGSDTLYGDAGDDVLYGGAGQDFIYGGDGRDHIHVGFNLAHGTVLAANDVAIGEFVDGGNGGIDNDTLTVDITGYGWARIDLVYDPLDHENGTITFFASDGTTVVGTLVFRDIENLIIVCFTAGTQIMTERGAVAVEALAPGDMVVTRDNGLQPLRWLGSRKLSYAELLAEPNLQPVRIAAGALAVGPDRTMLVSPQHRVLIEGARAEMYFGESEVLVPARHLVGMAEITRALPVEGVTYVHVLFDRHEIVQSDGIWTESFQPAERTLDALDEAARAEVLQLFPELATDATGFPAARLSLKAHEARVLVSG